MRNGLLVENLCVIFQAHPWTITKAFPGRPHRGKLPSPPLTWGTVHALQSLRGTAVKDSVPSACHVHHLFALLAQEPSLLSLSGVFSRGLHQVPLPRSPYRGLGREGGNLKDTSPPLSVASFSLAFPHVSCPLGP